MLSKKLNPRPLISRKDLLRNSDDYQMDGWAWDGTISPKVLSPKDRNPGTVPKIEIPGLSQRFFPNPNNHSDLCSNGSDWTRVPSFLTPSDLAVPKIFVPGKVHYWSLIIKKHDVISCRIREYGSSTYFCKTTWVEQIILSHGFRSN